VHDQNDAKWLEAIGGDALAGSGLEEEEPAPEFVGEDATVSQPSPVFPLSRAALEGLRIRTGFRKEMEN
jgi:hypothetical protein